MVFAGLTFHIQLLQADYHRAVLLRQTLETHGAIYKANPEDPQCQVIIVFPPKDGPAVSYTISDGAGSDAPNSGWTYDNLCLRFARRPSNEIDPLKHTRKTVIAAGWVDACVENGVLLQERRWGLWEVMATNPSRTRGVIKPARAADASLADTSLNLISTSIASELEQVSATIEEPADSRLFAGWQRHPHATGPVLFHVAPAPKQQDWEETITGLGGTIAPLEKAHLIIFRANLNKELWDVLASLKPEQRAVAAEWREICAARKEIAELGPFTLRKPFHGSMTTKEEPSLDPPKSSDPRRNFKRAELPPTPISPAGNADVERRESAVWQPTPGPITDATTTAPSSSDTESAGDIEAAKQVHAESSHRVDNDLSRDKEEVPGSPAPPPFAHTHGAEDNAPQDNAPPERPAKRLRTTPPPVPANDPPVVSDGSGSSPPSIARAQRKEGVMARRRRNPGKKRQEIRDRRLDFLEAALRQWVETRTRSRTDMLRNLVCEGLPTDSPTFYKRNKGKLKRRMPDLEAAFVDRRGAHGYTRKRSKRSDIVLSTTTTNGGDARHIAEGEAGPSHSQHLDHHHHDEDEQHQGSDDGVADNESDSAPEDNAPLHLENVIDGLGDGLGISLSQQIDHDCHGEDENYQAHARSDDVAGNKEDDGPLHIPDNVIDDLENGLGPSHSNSQPLDHDHNLEDEDHAPQASGDGVVDSGEVSEPEEGGPVHTLEHDVDDNGNDEPIDEETDEGVQLMSNAELKSLLLASDVSWAWACGPLPRGRRFL